MTQYQCRLVLSSFILFIFSLAYADDVKILDSSVIIPRTLGEMNKCIKENAAPLYTDAKCPEEYELHNSSWEESANFSYMESKKAEVISIDMREIISQSILGVVTQPKESQNAKSKEKSSQRVEGVREKENDINFEKAFKYGLRMLFDRDALIEEVIGN